MAMGASAYAQPSSWKIDPLHSSAQIQRQAPDDLHRPGRPIQRKCTVVWDPENPSATSVDARSDCLTVNTGEPRSAMRFPENRAVLRREELPGNEVQIQAF